MQQKTSAIFTNNNRFIIFTKEERSNWKAQILVLRIWQSVTRLIESRIKTPTPYLSFELTSTPICNKKFTTSSCPFKDAFHKALLLK